jgi:hypothetical protein
VVANDHAIYAGGHFRWLNNVHSTNGHDFGGGSVDRLGMAAIDPLNGLTLRKWRADVTSMDVIDGHLYFTRTDANLYRASISGAAVQSETTIAISGPAIGGRKWDNRMLAFIGVGNIINAGSEDTVIFDVNPGDMVEADVTWDDPNADVRIFLRDESNSLITRDTDGLPATVSTIAQTSVSGHWVLASRADRLTTMCW